MRANARRNYERLLATAVEVVAELLGAEEGREYHAKILDAGHRLLSRAQQAGEANEATDIDDLLLLVNAISQATEDDAERADALLTVVVAGVRRSKPVE